jgi:hypothetical protein
MFDFVLDNLFDKYKITVPFRKEARIHIRGVERGVDSHSTVNGWLECPECGGPVSLVVPVAIHRTYPPSKNWGRLAEMNHKDCPGEYHTEDCYPLVCVECKEWFNTPYGLEVDI